MKTGAMARANRNQTTDCRRDLGLASEPGATTQQVTQQRGRSESSRPVSVRVRFTVNAKLSNEKAPPRTRGFVFTLGRRPQSFAAQRQLNAAFLFLAVNDSL